MEEVVQIMIIAALPARAEAPRTVESSPRRAMA
jgi:hypothetical protein